MKPLATEMEKVSNGFSAMPTKIQKLIKETDKIPSSAKKAAGAFTDLYHQLKSVMNIASKVGKKIWSSIEESMDYTENMNLFTVSMGEYASEANTYAEKVSDAMGIDTSEWVRAQGVFMTLATGFGVASDRAYTMSKSLTQLSYDLSSFYNMDIEDAMTKVKSGLAGELEPLRAIGYDLSQAKLEATAFELGITKSVSAMTQAEKAQLRYYAIMTQVTHTQGDMARTLEDPANQVRVFKAQLNMASREIGNMFIPALNAIIPYATAIAKVIGVVASTIAALFGYKDKETEETTSKVVSNTDSITNNLSDANEEAKKLRSYMLGIDELNVINPNTESTDPSGWVDFELPSYLKDGEDMFMSGLVESKVNTIVEEMKEWLGITEDITTWSELMDTRFGNILKTVGLIGVGLTAWKIAPAVAKTIEWLSKLSLKNIKIGFKFIGLDLLLSDLDKLKQYFEDYVENGATFSNVTGMLSEFAGALGDAMLLLGKVKIAGALKVVQGLGEIASAIGDIAENGVDFTNVTDLVRGLSNLGIGLGLLTKNAILTGVSMTIQGLTTVIQELAENWDAIKQGDWSGVDKATLVVGVITTIGGIVVAFQTFEKITGATKLASSADKIKEVATATESVSTTTSTLTTTLKTLATNLALGIVIIAEVAVAAGIIVGAIWGLGLMLEQVGIAWQPVIDNGNTVLIALGLGTALLVGVGIGTALLGTLGATMVGQIALGIAILALISATALLFIAEIWLIGKGLDEIGVAWQPVLDNGENINTAIVLGTALLVGIGVVTALLGAASVATAGALPVAIALGTALLVELGIAFIAFTDSLIDVANKLSEELHPALDDANKILPDLTTNMSNFTTFMSGFASEVVDYSKDTAIAGISGTISKVIGFFTGDPVKKMTKEVKSQKTQFDDLIKELKEVIPKIKEAIGLQSEYNTAMSQFSTLEGDSNGGGFLSSIGDFFGSLFNGSRSSDNASVSVPSVPTYATGGFPETGQMFIAREAGAEMVGSIGRRTAVANNDQIVSSVAGGVAEANEEQNTLLREQNSLLRAILEKDSGVYLDGKNLANSVEKYQRERGRVLVTGGVL